MALQTFTWRVEKRTRPTWRASIRQFNFGDGYSQNSPQGLNPVKAEIAVVVPSLSRAQRDAVHAFFKANAGRPFLFAYDGDPLQKFTCEEWSEEKHRPDLYTVNATFKQVHTNQT